MVVYFKDWAEIEGHYDERFDLKGLTDAEQQLKDAVASGLPCDLDKTYPKDVAKCLPPKPEDWSNPDPTRHIRADILRFVLLQSVKHGEMTEAGTLILGAQITGWLELRNARILADCGLIACRFQNAIVANRAQFKSQAVFRHSTLPALSAMGATITGALDCSRARFVTTDGEALNLQGAQITGDLFLRDITAASTIDIQGATIKGQLSCGGARFEAANGTALDLQETEIHGGFFFREVKSVSGTINLGATCASTIFDDAASWALVDDLILDGFRYESISGDTKPTFAERMQWLEKGSVWKDEFRPQPYTQLADTYKRAGHDREARDVRVALARKLADEHFKELKKADQSTHDWFQKTKAALPFAAKWCSLPILWAVKILPRHIRMGWYRSVNCMFDWVVGYGFKPSKSLVWLLGLFALATLLSFGTWRAGDFTPNSAPILVSEDWKAVAHLDNAAEQWTENGAAGQDWESFNSFAYAADIVIPIVEIGQTSAWAPSPARGAWGWTLWWARWLFTAAGWIISALGAAAITGVIRRE